MSLDLKGLSRAQALAALYNASRPLGMGFLHYDATSMTEQEAENLLQATKYFDYLKGRVMKLDFGKDEIEPRLYDRDNGPGAAQRAVDAAASGDEEALRRKHQKGVKDAAADAIESMNTPTTIGESVINLTLEDVKDVLGPKVDEIIKKIGEN